MRLQEEDVTHHHMQVHRIEQQSLKRNCTSSSLNAWNAQNTSFQLEQNKLKNEDIPLTTGGTTPCSQENIQEKATGSTDKLVSYIKSF